MENSFLLYSGEPIKTSTILGGLTKISSLTKQNGIIRSVHVPWLLQKLLTFNCKQKYSDVKVEFHTQKRTPHYIWRYVKNNSYVVSFVKKHSCRYMQNFVCAASHTAKVRLTCISNLSPFQLQHKTIFQTLQKLKLHDYVSKIAVFQLQHKYVRKWQQPKKNSTQHSNPITFGAKSGDI